MKKFEEELFSKVPCKFGLNTEGEYKQSILIKHFKDWISPEDHQAEIEKIELQNLKYREEIERMQKSLRKKNKAIKELNGAIKKSKARLKECEDLRIEANNKAAMEYSRKCEVVEDRAELKRENQRLRAENLAVKTLVDNAKPQQALPVVPEFVAEWIEILKTKGLKPLKNPETYGETGFTEEKLQNIVFWISENQEDYMRAWLDGYTVEKPQLFYLKNKLTDMYLYKKPLGGYGEEPTSSIKYLTDDFKFTQQEIDSMETGSYEQIEVEK